MTHDLSVVFLACVLIGAPVSCSSGPGGSEDAEVEDVLEAPEVTEPHDVVPDADCEAGPGILGLSGDFSPGSTVVITGCTFGVKDPAQPLIWDRVDNQSEYGSLETHMTVPTGDSMPWEENGEHLYINNAKFYSGPEARYPGGWTYWCPADEDPKGRCWLGGRDLGLPDETDLYVSWWYKVDNCTPSDHATTTMLRIWPDDTGLTGRMSLTFNQWNLTDLWNETDSTFSSEHSTWWQGREPCDSTWSHYEALFLHGGTTDHGIHGTMTVRRDGAVRCAQDTGGDPVFCENRSWEAATAFDRIMILGLDISEPDRPAVEPTNAWFTDIYVDVTRARVFAGDSAHFSSVTHFELQIPVAWSEEEITVQVHRGSFEAGGHAWLYVVDAEGNHNPYGYPIGWP